MGGTRCGVRSLFERRSYFLKGKTALRYILQIVITLLGISFIMFSLTMLSTQDLAKQLITGAEDIIVSQEQIDRVTKELGLDQPFLVQYWNWLVHAVQGDFGFSYMAKKPVVDKLMECLPATIYLGLASLVLMLIISVPLGVLSAFYSNKPIDYICRGASFFGISVPGFWLGLMLLWFFGLKLGWFPIVSTRMAPDTIFLPALTLAISMSSKYMRQVRSTVLEELHQDYVIGARARGMSISYILIREVLPNALLPLITLLGLSLGSLLGGAAVVELVFNWPGLGNLAIKAIEYRDFLLLQGVIVWIASMYMIINLLVDFSYSLLDPRLKKKGGA